MNALTLVMPADLDVLDRTFAIMQPNGSWTLPKWLVALHEPYGTAFCDGIYVIDWRVYRLNYSGTP